MPIIDLLKALVELKGSDLHLIAGRPPAVRVHGELRPLPGAERLAPDATRDLIYELLTEDQKNQF